MKHNRISEPPNRAQVLAASRRYITLAEAADILGCHPRTVRRLVSRGLISGHRLGARMLRVDLAEIESVMHEIPTAGMVAS